MIQNKVYRLKKTIEPLRGVVIPAGQEIEIVMDVIYMNGYPLPIEFQPIIYNWMMNNLPLFEDVTRKW